MEPDHVKNSKSGFEADLQIPSENERKSSDFAPYGMAVEGDQETGHNAGVESDLLTACCKSRPVRAPGLQYMPISEEIL